MRRNFKVQKPVTMYSRMNYLLRRLVDHRPLTYRALIPFVGSVFSNDYGYQLQVNGTPLQNGPGIMVGAHIWATDPIAVGLAVREKSSTRLVSVYTPSRHMRGGKEFTHIVASIFGEDFNSSYFRDRLFETWYRNLIALNFPEGDMPRKIWTKAKGGIIKPSEIPVTKWDESIFTYAKEYEKWSGEGVRCQPVGIKINCLPNWIGCNDGEVGYLKGYTIPEVCRLMVVSFGDAIDSREHNATTLGHELMKRAASLSDRPYDDSFYKRTVRESNVLAHS